MLGTASAVAQDNLESIKGSVVDAVGSQVPNAEVIIAGPVSRKANADLLGEFVVAGLAPGTYRVRIQKPGFSTRELDVRVGDGKETSLGPIVLEVRSHPCVGHPNEPRISEIKSTDGRRTVSGMVRVGNTAVEDVVIRLVAAGTSNVIAVTTSDHKGDFHFVSVKPGAYDLEISYGGGELTRATLRVRNDHSLDVLLTWQPWPAGQLCL